MPATPFGRSTGGSASVVVAVQAGFGSTGADASRSIGTATAASVASLLAGSVASRLAASVASLLAASVASLLDTPVASLLAGSVASLLDTACACVQPHVMMTATAKKSRYGVMPIIERST